MAALQGLLAGSRLVTVTGPGGVGKTRLAAEAAAGWLVARNWRSNVRSIKEHGGWRAAARFVAVSPAAWNGSWNVSPENPVVWVGSQHFRVASVQVPVRCPLPVVAARSLPPVVSHAVSFAEPQPTTSRKIRRPSQRRERRSHAY
jgi:hypothetical protein